MIHEDSVPGLVKTIVASSKEAQREKVMVYMGEEVLVWCYLGYTQPRPRGEQSEGAACRHMGSGKSQGRVGVILYTH